MIRVRAGLSFGLAEATGQGHCGLPVAELTRSTSELIEVGAGLIGDALQLELQDGELVADTVDGEACVFLAGLYRSEQAIARAAAPAVPGPPALAGDRRGARDPLGGGQDGAGPGTEPAGGADPGGGRQRAGDHRRPRRG